VEQIRIEQGQQRIAQLERELDRRAAEQKIAKSQAQGGSNTQSLLIALVGILMFAVVGLAVLVIRRRP
jgi:hypothetical protein